MTQNQIGVFDERSEGARSTEHACRPGLRGGRDAACRWRWDYVFWLPRMIDLDEGDLYAVPKGTKHRPVYESAVIYMLIEPEEILNPCNTGGS